MAAKGHYVRATRRPDWSDPREDQSLRDAWTYTSGSVTKIGRMLALSHGQVIGRSRTIGLHVTTFRPMNLKPSNAAVREGRTRFPSRVTLPDDKRVLKSGRSNTKLGGKVTKGAWKGMPIYSLTLEERATCPTTCKLWRSCYGNRMHLATRYKVGPELIYRLQQELRKLQERHPRGFVVRLHVLGDFYSTAYVDKWAEWLLDFPALRIFGYTAWQTDTPIGHTIARWRDLMWGRFAIRTSGAEKGPRTAVYPAGLLAGLMEKDAIPCPAQVNKTASCGTCALCWSTTRPIAFLEH